MAWVAQMSTTALVEADDRWALPLSGRKVERLCLDFAVTLMFGGGFELRIEQPFVLEAADGADVLLVPQGDAERLAPVMGLVHREVTRADAFKRGHLEIVFFDGSKLGVPGDEGFEAWDFVGPDGLRIVSLPGGDLAVWRPADAARGD